MSILNFSKNNLHVARATFIVSVPCYSQFNFVVTMNHVISGDHEHQLIENQLGLVSNVF
jgi:hypothetical protein